VSTARGRGRGRPAHRVGAAPAGRHGTFDGRHWSDQDGTGGGWWRRGSVRPSGEPPTESRRTARVVRAEDRLRSGGIGSEPDRRPPTDSSGLGGRLATVRVRVPTDRRCHHRSNVDGTEDTESGHRVDRSCRECRHGDSDRGTPPNATGRSLRRWPPAFDRTVGTNGAVSSRVGSGRVGSGRPGSGVGSVAGRDPHKHRHPRPPGRAGRGVTFRPSRPGTDARFGKGPGRGNGMRDESGSAALRRAARGPRLATEGAPPASQFLEEVPLFPLELLVVEHSLLV
jgi:hypothetical protein